MAHTASSTATGATRLLDSLEQLGVELVFGLPGVHNLPIWKALSDSEIRLVGVRHEQTAVYAAVTTAASGAFARLGVRGYLMCHLSHSYHAGACLYFTFALRPTPSGDTLAEYDVVKASIQQAFVDNGATLSHHHAVGTEHAQWLEQDISRPGVVMLRSLFEGSDPGRHLNPGKIVS